MRHTRVCFVLAALLASPVLALAERVNFPSQNGCIAWKRGELLQHTHEFEYFIRNQCAYQLTVYWCESCKRIPGKRDGWNRVEKIRGGGNIRGTSSMDADRHTSLFAACQEQSGSSEVFVDEYGECHANVNMR